MEFQSTLPVGGATQAPRCTSPGSPYFNPRSPWGERPGAAFWALPRIISIHAPRGGSDSFPYFHALSSNLFQSTLPVGGATCSIRLCYLLYSHFNPRSPWGERPLIFLIAHTILAFQSTLPVGGATRGLRHVKPAQGISIHAPRGGSDFICNRYCISDKDFNPRSPWGERQQRCTNFPVHLWREIQKREKMEIIVRENCTEGRNKRRFCTKSRCEPTGSFLFA